MNKLLPYAKSFGVFEAVLIEIREVIAEILFKHFGICWAWAVLFIFGNITIFEAFEYKQNKCGYCCRCFTDAEFEKYQKGT